MSDTPRTYYLIDQARFPNGVFDSQALADFARELERELTNAKAQVPDGYQLAFDTLSEQVAAMAVGLQVFSEYKKALGDELTATRARLAIAEEALSETCDALEYFKDSDFWDHGDAVALNNATNALAEIRGNAEGERL